MLRLGQLQYEGVMLDEHASPEEVRRVLEPPADGDAAGGAEPTARRDP